MYYDGSITIMWSLNLFINGVHLPCRRVKHQSCQDIRLWPSGVSTIWTFWIYPGAAESEWGGKSRPETVA